MTENILSDMALGRRLTRRAGLEARPYYAQTSDDHPDKGWTEDEVHIFHRGTEIGCYSRPYRHLGSQTFEPFEQGGKWYALYSADYTCTRVMSLPDCRDLGGEAHDKDSFCPAEIYVPRYRAVRWRGSPAGQYNWYFESSAENILAAPDQVAEIGPWQSLGIGFVHGCVWACPYEIQVFDLAQAAQGVLARTAPFGRAELANLPLALASLLRLECSPPEPLIVTFTADVRHELVLPR